MDKEGIGTDATISEHIATILKRNYAEKNPAGRRAHAHRTGARGDVHVPRLPALQALSPRPHGEGV